MEIRRVSEDDYESFLREKEYAVVLFDAPWDLGPGALIRPLFEKAAGAFGGRVNFGEVNSATPLAIMNGWPARFVQVV